MRAMETAAGATPASAASDVARWLENRQEEIDSQFQYLAMADGEPRANVADVYRRLAAIEDKHAAFWERHLREAGRELGPRRPSARARILGWLARRVGAGSILPTIAASEYAARNDYLA